jgi:hypothetical protein
VEDDRHAVARESFARRTRRSRAPVGERSASRTAASVFLGRSGPTRPRCAMANWRRGGAGERDGAARGTAAHSAALYFASFTVYVAVRVGLRVGRGEGLEAAGRRPRNEPGRGRQPREARAPVGAVISPRAPSSARSRRRTACRMAATPACGVRFVGT